MTSKTNMTTYNGLKMQDEYTMPILLERVKLYLQYKKANNDINKKLSKKKIRNENFPSDISENIVKFVIANKNKVMPTWNTKKGDLVIKEGEKIIQIEVKGFMSDGPSSFGPKEEWELLYFIDARDIINKKFKVYEIKLTNKSEIFRSIKLSQSETYGEIADSGRRPRGVFENIFQPQLGEHCKLIFDGNLLDLMDTTII